MSTNWYLSNPLIHQNREKTEGSMWQQSFDCSDMRPLIICRGPIRMETMTVFEEMGIRDYGILLSEKDSITYSNALSPELRKHSNGDAGLMRKHARARANGGNPVGVLS